jgi:hypothetical protein
MLYRPKYDKLVFAARIFETEFHDCDSGLKVDRIAR